jgi:hypothetical protein
MQNMWSVAGSVMLKSTMMIPTNVIYIWG